MELMEFIIFLIQDIFPIIAVIISALSYRDSRKVNELERKIKAYEWEKIEKSKRPDVEVSIQDPSKSKPILKIKNIGQETAYDVNFIDKEEIGIRRDKIPFEKLEPGQSFGAVCPSGIPPKFDVTITWKDERGKSDLKEQTVSY